MPTAHWRMAVAPLLSALRPRTVVAVAVEQWLVAALTELGEHLGFTTTSEAAAPDADVVVAGRHGVVDYGVERPLVLLFGRPGTDVPSLGPAYAVRAADGFGGLIAIATVSALHSRPEFSAAWERVGGLEHLAAVCTELESTREALGDRLRAGENASDRLLSSVQATMAELHEALAAKRRLELRLEQAAAVAETAQQQLAAERAWVVEQVSFVEASRSWRVGHGLARALRRLSRREAGSSDALSVIVRRMDGGEPPQGP